MVSRNALRWTLATLALLGASSVSAGPINFTGFVENDFNSEDDSVKVIQGAPDPLNRIVQMPEMTAQGIINGYALKDMRLSYDYQSDRLYVGLNTYSIAGNAIGNGGADLANRLNQLGGVDPANLGGNKSITVGIAGKNLNDSLKPGSTVLLAGVPADKAYAGSGLNGFTVTSYVNRGGIQNSYGSQLPNHQGTLAFSPSAAHPGFEFTIENFSKISPNLLDPAQGFWIRAYLGSPNDNPIGEESTAYMFVPSFGPQVPEPATLLSWTVVAAAAGALRLRRRRVA
ncbi:hypothetical protein V5E97_30505 [Singulisphaera sp. Ch08]|uniref:PEP-CTERM sorting domain-containing protein n=1 Tax=Singulisphaera sp. Ch08 TaxID=3120278 RepID=A0AAU7CBZ4_9BACT